MYGQPPAPSVRAAVVSAIRSAGARISHTNQILATQVTLM